MKEFTAQEARAEAKARNDIARIKKEIYEHIYKAATNGKYCVVYHPEHIELEMAQYDLVMHEFGNKGYKVAWFNNLNELLIIWKGEE